MATKEQRRLWLNNWRKQNPERVKVHQKDQARREIEQLKPAYLKRQVKTRKRPVTVEAMRDRLLIRRASKIFQALAASSAISGLTTKSNTSSL
jgi:hypothetical protein